WSRQVTEGRVYASIAACRAPSERAVGTRQHPYPDAATLLRAPPRPLDRGPRVRVHVEWQGAVLSQPPVPWHFPHRLRSTGDGISACPRQIGAGVAKRRRKRWDLCPLFGLLVEAERPCIRFRAESDRTIA